MITIPRSFRNPTPWVLFGIILVAIVLRVRAAESMPLHFDDHWIIFASTAQPFSQFIAEVRDVTHPPLPYVLLRLMLLGGDTGSYQLARLIGLIPGLLSIPAVFLCARRLDLGRNVSWLAALLLALSPAHVAISVSTRAYSMTILFLLLGYAEFLRMLGSEEKERGPLRAMLVWLSLAMWTEYCAWFAVGAMFILVLRAGPRRWWSDPVAIAGFVVSSLLLLGYLQWSVGVHRLGHIKEFLPDGGPLWRFALVAMERIFASFSSLPFSLFSTVLLLLAGVIWLLPGAIRALFDGKDLARASAPLILVQLLAILFGLALLRLYPFGGEVRHQSVLLPFLVFCLLLLLDRGRRALPAARYGVADTLVFVAVLIYGAWVSRLPLPEQPVWNANWPADAARLLAAAGDEPIYAPAYSSYGLSGCLPGRVWRAQENCGEGCRRFVVTAHDGTQLTVIKDAVTWDVTEFADAKFAVRVQTVLAAARQPAIWIYSLDTPTKHGLPAEIVAKYHELDLDATPGPKLAVGEAWRVSTAKQSSPP